MFAMKEAVSLIVTAAGLAVGAAGAPTLMHVADTHVADVDFSNARQVQTMSLANDGHYAPSYEALTSGELGLKAEFRKGGTVAYTVSPDRKHYVIAEQLSTGGVAVGSDTGYRAVCDAYTVECVARVTDDVSLIHAAPQWITTAAETTTASVK